jgi:hypothetical protein
MACGSSVEGGGGGTGGGGSETTSADTVGSVSSSGVGGASATSTSITSAQGGGSVTTTVGPGGAGGACGTPAPVGAVEFCGGSASASSGMGFQCGTLLCDEAQNQWESLCDSSGHCTCSYNAVEVCSCEVAQGDGCVGVGCCPAPWPDP